MSEKEERERKLQIDLARLQTDIQILFGWLLSCIAVAGAFIIAGVQLNPTTQYGYLSFVGAIIFIVLAFNYSIRLSKKRKELNSLN